LLTNLEEFLKSKEKSNVLVTVTLQTLTSTVTIIIPQQTHPDSSDEASNENHKNISETE
jgi:hypothetical protein